jgi:cytochrome o ubiquinol oxidase operon protein cyoD
MQKGEKIELPSGALRGSFKSYLIGFILSIGMTLAAYFLVVADLASKKILIFTVVGLALVQMVTQLLFFFHLAEETKPRWNLQIFLAMLFLILIIIGGSLWIMFNLDERVMPSMSPLMDLHQQG